ncbi:sulfite exporter TauE/SafE family protein [Aquamicrobium sp. LC103]|nr:sulfite exporter TauE/SafE family protein [Aquamicrobium sp. LC103]TKT69397.1 sulfite exporter TauE/SafE family protein [Aquamicrobium sp. LC103]
MPAIIAEHWELAIGLLAAGAFAGILAGLLGVGGGIVIVPVLYLLLDSFDVDNEVAMKIAVASSLSTILVTAISSARSHRKRGAVDEKLLKSWGVPIFIGVVLGTIAGGYLHGDVLTAVFATVALIVAANMVFRGQGTQLYEGFPNGFIRNLSGLVVGVFSAMMGIGGGTLAVPILTTFGYDIRRAVGTSSAIGFVIAVPGTIGYILAGWGVEDLPPGSLGYVNIPAFIAFVPLTVLFAPVGARLAHAIPPKALRYSFAVFLLITAIRMFAGLID